MPHFATFFWCSPPRRPPPAPRRWSRATRPRRDGGVRTSPASGSDGLLEPECAASRSAAATAVPRTAARGATTADVARGGGKVGLGVTRPNGDRTTACWRKGRAACARRAPRRRRPRRRRRGGAGEQSGRRRRPLRFVRFAPPPARRYCSGGGILIFVPTGRLLMSIVGLASRILSTETAEPHGDLRQRVALLHLVDRDADGTASRSTRTTLGEGETAASPPRMPELSTTRTMAITPPRKTIGTAMRTIQRQTDDRGRVVVAVVVLVVRLVAVVSSVALGRRPLRRALRSSSSGPANTGFRIGKCREVAQTRLGVFDAERRLDVGRHPGDRPGSHSRPPHPRPGRRAAGCRRSTHARAPPQADRVVPRRPAPPPSRKSPPALSPRVEDRPRCIYDETRPHLLPPHRATPRPARPGPRRRGRG